jgi:hypothetical protein
MRRKNKMQTVVDRDMVITALENAITVIKEKGISGWSINDSEYGFSVSVNYAVAPGVPQEK